MAKIIKGITWVGGWRPGTLNVPSGYTDKCPYYGGFDIHLVRGNSTGTLNDQVYVYYEDTNDSKIYYMRVADFIVASGTNYGGTFSFFADIASLNRVC